MADVNEVILNGETILSTRENTVTENTLLEDETAQEKSGKKIVGLVPPIEVDDELSDTSTNPVENRVITEQLSNKADTSDVPSKLSELENDAGYVTDDEAYIKSDPEGTIDDADYIPFQDVTDGTKKKTLFSAIVTKLKDTFATITGNNITDPNTFRSNIKTIDQQGTAIPSNADLDSYTTAGTYYVINNTIANTISNIPEIGSGKLIVITDDTNNGTDHRFHQLYMLNSNVVYIRHRDYSQSGGGFTDWMKIAKTTDISPSTVGNGYAVGTVSGTAITATISGFKLRAGVIVAIKIPSEITTACTLNINSTGAKNILTWDGDVSFGESLAGGNKTYTFMYDGTQYRVLSLDATPRVLAQNYVADTSGNILMDWGYASNRAQIKHILGQNKLSWNYYKNSAWRGDVTIADYDDLGASIAKTGKSILPIWRHSTNTVTSNGVTATFNPLTGEITVNGTATANTYFPIYTGKNLPSTAKLPKGTYILSGCPSGGSSSTYELDFYCSEGSWFEHGSGVTFTLSSDANLNDDLFIFVANGQTVSNLVFKPMLRPAFTTADYEPCEDIHKGNCYVGTCTTAGATKDKEAYVDGYFVLRKGVRVAIKFSNTNTYSSTTASPVTLNVNGTGAKNIWFNNTHSGAGNTGAYTTIYGVANLYYYFVYDGTYWVWDGRDMDNNTTYTNMTLGNGYGTCATAESTTAKVVTLANYNPLLGGYVSVKFTYAVPANATMNINSKGAKNIWYRGANLISNVIRAGDLATFIYDGTRYQLIGVDRDNALTISYNYKDSAGTPNYVTRDSNVLMPQLSYVRRGDIVQVACIIRFVSAKTYSAGSVLFSGLPSPPTGWVHCENGGVNFWYAGGSMHNRNSLTVTAGKAFFLGFTYIEA